MDRKTWEELPDELRAGASVAVTTCIFTQGINEMQSVANFLGKSGYQKQINELSLKRLSGYVDSYLGAVEKGMSSGISRDEAEADLRQIATEVAREDKSKNTDVVQLSSALTRKLRGGRVTLCKSGKDRTSMSVTLEQAQAIRGDVFSSSGVGGAEDHRRTIEVANLARRHGVRRENVARNVGGRKGLYAFNKLQHMMLPSEYQPPEGTYGSAES